MVPLACRVSVVEKLVVLIVAVVVVGVVGIVVVVVVVVVVVIIVTVGRCVVYFMLFLPVLHPRIAGSGE